MKIVYFDCFSGASGDMLLGALLDAGASEEFVRAQLATLRLPGWELAVSVATKQGIRATKARVTTGDDEHARTYQVIASIIEEAALETRVKRTALRAFEILARAEAHVHQTEVQHVHFHEVGGLDAIVDIVGSSAALADLSPDAVVTSPIPTGSGTIATAHGILPVPAPAVVEILRGAPLLGRGEHELVTPTGAAFLRAVTSSFGPVPAIELEAIGYGAGERDGEMPNVLRVLVGQSVSAGHGDDSQLLLETNVDDMNPELIPHVIESLFAAGAEDAWVTPIVMKKGRPAFTLSLLARGREHQRLLDLIYRETTTFGVRITPLQKDALERRWVEVEVAGQPLRVKLALRGGDVVTVSPEYDEAVKVARASGIALKQVYALATEAARSTLAGQTPR